MMRSNEDSEEMPDRIRLAYGGGEVREEVRRHGPGGGRATYEFFEHRQTKLNIPRHFHHPYLAPPPH